ncbi:MAG TPA: hypothetical protein VK862_12470 [Afifellaceae bacterium]|nr:hypothetical protein [Afifellaceae bacterium]
MVNKFNIVVSNVEIMPAIDLLTRMLPARQPQDEAVCALNKAATFENRIDWPETPAIPGFCGIYRHCADQPRTLSNESGCQRTVQGQAVFNAASPRPDRSLRDDNNLFIPITRAGIQLIFHEFSILKALIVVQINFYLTFPGTTE